nr:hypothetical protein [uncultured Aminipila sp.]
MKLKFLGVTMLALMVLFIPAITVHATDTQEQLTMQVEKMTEDAHNKIIERNEIKSEDWIKFDISDLSAVSNGMFPNIPQEVGKKFIRLYYIGQIEEKYHEDGDFKPLFLINNDLQTAKVGFLHENGETTIIDINLNEIKANSMKQLSRASYTVSGSCSLKKSTSGATYSVISSGKTTTSKKVDNVYCSITTYMNGTKLALTSNNANNASSVSVQYVTPPNQFPAQYEVQGTHFGFLGDSIVDYYSSYSKSFSN